MRPLLTLEVHSSLQTARRTGGARVECSLDLGRSASIVEVYDKGWIFRGEHFPFIENCKDRTIYYWTGASFEAAARFTTSLVKLVPTHYGPPTFEIDGIKMLPTAHVSPYADAGRKVDLIGPEGKIVLDTCGGLGYFAAWCIERHAKQVLSYEKDPNVIWLRSINPWSPQGGDRLTLTQADIADVIHSIPDNSVHAILHDPPRFGIAGELYSQAFYNELARVIKRHGKLFHYTGTPNKLTSGRDVPAEVAKRLREARFATTFAGDGVLATKK